MFMHNELMRMYSVGAALVLSLVSSSVQADEIAKLPLNKQVKLLNGRLSATLPQSAKIEARGHNIMAAPEAEEDETRVVVEAGKEKLVLIVNELYALAGKDFAENAAKYMSQFQQEKNQWLISKVPSSSKKGLSYVRATQQGAQESKSNDSHLLVMAIVANKDGTVQLCSVYANDLAYKDWSKLTITVDQILDSLASGSRSLKLTARTVPAGILEGLTIKVPGNVATSIQRGVDFTVLHCDELKELGSPETSLGIYCGGWPSFYPPENARKVQDYILGKKIEWLEGAIASGADKGKRFSAQALVPVFTNKTGYTYQAHLFIKSPDQSGVERMKQIARTLTLRKPNSKRGS